MDKKDTVDAIVDKLIFIGSSHWQQREYKEDFFRIFSESQKNERGIPLLSGDCLKECFRETNVGDPTNDKNIEENFYSVCEAWDEWIFALKNWSKPLG